MDDVLDAIWACMNCNTTFRLGRMKSGPLYNSPLRCPNCDSDNTSPADGEVKAIPEYHGPIGTKN
jgi:DNA-directed RNA polymerase subunit RPC12/RpoP